MSDFTPVTSLIGGLFIGASAVWLLAALGRLAGISNMLHALLDRQRWAEGRQALWRPAFLLGLIGGTTAWFLWTGAPVTERPPLPPLWLVAGGLLVGYGTSMGNGCTSGHGVCGLGRRSLRSLVATLVFMTTGVLTVFVVRHVIGGAA